MATIDAATRHDLTNAQWALLEPLLPAVSGRGRPRRWPIRGLVDGVRHRTRVGCPWRDVPDRYGPWWRVYTLFACWQLLGVWARVEAALRQEANTKGRLSWQVSVDSTTSRAHIHAAGARRDSVNRVAEATRTPRTGSITWWMGNQDPRRDRPAPRRPVLPAHARPGWRQSPVHPSPRADPGGSARARRAPSPTSAGPG